MSEQLTEMAIGVRQQFDLAGVALAMGSAGLSNKIKIDNPLEQRLVSDIAVAGMSSVVRGRFDVENLATQLITDAAAVGMQQRQTKPVSDDYQESQKASRGAGKITQTTIEQQWESQLINDAEFTANAQLPSVTFDVNNSYVSQQLGQRVGEEVSHFYHPTSPPRNPNGFWQRAWNSVEDVFEHRALIAEGRASAYSEVMRDSVGHEAANEQNYLDLGYSESVVQTRAAEWTAATELPLPSVAKGMMQASSLMNKWGLFGRAEESAEFNYKFKPGLDVFHFKKHGMQIANKFDLGRDYDIKQYIEDANFVIKNGIYVPELNAYVKIPVGIGTARAPFVGLDRLTNEITTLHLKPVTYLERQAPSLGWSTKPSFEINKFLDVKQDPDWISLNTRMTP